MATSSTSHVLTSDVPKSGTLNSGVQQSNAEVQKNPIYLQPYFWKDCEENGRFNIYIACHTKDSQMAVVKVEDYNLYCNIELPSSRNGIPIVWTVNDLKTYAAWLRKCLDNHQPIEINFQMKSKLIYYQECQYPFLTCTFDTTDALRHCTNFLKKKAYNIYGLGEIKSTVWEANISNLHKFIAKNGFTYTGWLSIDNPNYITEYKQSRAPIEIVVSIANLKKVPKEICSTWTVNPRVGAIDLECYSSNHRAMPNPLHLSDVVFQCSYIDQILGKPETRKKYIIQLGACSDPKDCEIIRVSSEPELCDALMDLICKCNPALITGYNIFRFDLPYLDDRMKHYMRTKLKQCGLLYEEETTIKVSTWRSGAYGFVTISSLSTFGRMFVDMYTIIKRDYKLSQYTLEFVSQFFLKKGKNDVSPQRIFGGFKEVMDATKWLKESEGKDWEYAAKERLLRASDEMAIIAEYCAQDSCLCIELMEKLNTWLNILILSEIVEVTATDTFSRGQQIRVINQLYTRCSKQNIVITTRDIEDLTFKGGLVVAPEIGTHENVMIFDFASLYPSIIMAYNLCYSTLVDEHRTDIPDSMCHVAEWEEEHEIETVDATGKKIKRMQKFHYRHRFIRKEYRKGIIPQICEDLVNERARTRKLINPNNPANVNMIYDILQNVLKVSANSVCGGLSSRYGLPLIEAARVVTYRGRELNRKCQQIAKDHFMTISGGDTDSIFCRMNNPIDDPRVYKKIGEDFAAVLSNQFEKPLRVEFEKTYAKMILICPKMYAGIALVTIDKKNVISVEEFAINKEYDNGDTRCLKVTHNNKGKQEVTFLLFPKHLNHEDWVNDCIAGTPVRNELFVDQTKITVEKILSVEEMSEYKNYDTQKMKLLKITNENKERSLILVPKDLKYSSVESISGIAAKEEAVPDETKITKKGIIIARRDNCPWIRKAYLKILLNILFSRPLSKSIDAINDEIVNVMSRNVYHRDLLINKEIGTEYKEGSTYSMCIFAQELRKKGIVIEGGERVDYLMVRLPEQRTVRGAIVKQLQGLKMRLLNQFLAAHVAYENRGSYEDNEVLQIDTLYYVENQMQNRLQTLLYIGYRKTIEELSKEKEKKVYRRKQMKRTIIPTRVCEDFIKNYVKLLRVKQGLIAHINSLAPHIQGANFAKACAERSWNYREKYF